MLNTKEIILVIIYTIPSILHSFGLFLLIVTRFEEEEKTQKLFYIMLSMSELTISTMETTSFILDETADKYFPRMASLWLGYTLMYEIMIALTIDRFLKIFLNIKYPLYWKYSRTVKLVLTFCTVNCLSFLALSLAQTSIDDLYAYHCLPFDIVFLLVAIGTYSYILAMI